MLKSAILFILLVQNIATSSKRYNQKHNIYKLTSPLQTRFNVTDARDGQRLNVARHNTFQGNPPSEPGQVRSVNQEIILNPCSGPYCDPGYEPYANIVAAMVGYNLIKGNPYSTTVNQDPGFETAYIFAPIGADHNRRYALHSGITVRQVRKCNLVTNSRTVSSFSQYRNRIVKSKVTGSSFSSNPPIELEADVGILNASTTIKSIYESSFEASEESQKNAEFFKRMEGLLSVNDAKCAEYSLQISKWNPPPFSDTFKRGLLKLNEVVAAGDDDAISTYFYQFLNEFGTHYLTHATMGSRLAIERRYTRDEYANSGISGIDKCNKDRMGVNLFFSYSKSSTDCTSFQSTTLDSVDSDIQRESVTSFGSKPASDLYKWASQSFVAPLPIKFKMAPIIDIFRDSFHKGDDHLKNLDYEKILEKVSGLYDNYCVSVRGEVACRKSQKITCGVNDECDSLLQKCIPSSGSTDDICQYAFSADSVSASLLLEELVKKRIKIGVKTTQGFEQLRQDLERHKPEEDKLFLLHYKVTNSKCKLIIGDKIVSAISKNRLYMTYLGWQKNDPLTKVQRIQFRNELNTAFFNLKTPPPEGYTFDFLFKLTQGRVENQRLGFALFCQHDLDDSTVAEEHQIQESTFFKFEYRANSRTQGIVYAGFQYIPEIDLVFGK